MLLEPGNGDVAASDMQLRLDLAQLLAELALLVGPERAARSARGRSARRAGRRRDADPAGRALPLDQERPAPPRGRAARAPQGTAGHGVAGPRKPPVQLERHPAAHPAHAGRRVFAAYILAGELTRTSFGDLFRHANWHWTIVALGLSALTYVGAALVAVRVRARAAQAGRTLLAQIAASFVTLVTPAAVGGVALNIRYLRKSKVVTRRLGGECGCVAGHRVRAARALLLVFAALTGTMTDTSLRPPDWAYIGVAILVSVILIVLAVPPWRRLLLSRLAPTLGQVIPRLLDIAQRPAKLAEGIGGALLVTAAYIGCLDLSVRALGGSLPIISIAVVYLTGSAIGSAVPTPGGLGAVEAALSAGLTAAGLSGATAISSVLLFRAITFWLPVPIGWAALNYLQRHDAL